MPGLLLGGVVSGGGREDDLEGAGEGGEGVSEEAKEAGELGAWRMKNPYWKLAGVCFFASIGCLLVWAWSLGYQAGLFATGLLLFGAFATATSIAKDIDKENERKK